MLLNKLPEPTFALDRIPRWIFQ